MTSVISDLFGQPAKDICFGILDSENWGWTDIRTGGRITIVNVPAVSDFGSTLWINE